MKGERLLGTTIVLAGVAAPIVQNVSAEQLDEIQDNASEKFNFKNPQDYEDSSEAQNNPMEVPLYSEFFPLIDPDKPEEMMATLMQDPLFQNAALGLYNSTPPGEGYQTVLAVKESKGGNGAYITFVRSKTEINGSQLGLTGEAHFIEYENGDANLAAIAINENDQVGVAIHENKLKLVYWSSANQNWSLVAGSQETGYFLLEVDDKELSAPRFFIPTIGPELTPPTPEPPAAVPTPEFQLAGFTYPEPVVEDEAVVDPESFASYEEVMGNFETELFSNEPQFRSSDGRYQIRYSDDYLSQVANGSDIFIDQNAGDQATQYVFNYSYNQVNQELAKKNEPSINPGESVKLQDFAQIGGQMEKGKTIIEGPVNHIRHYIVTSKQLIFIREQFRNNTNLPKHIEPTFLSGSQSLTLGIAFFDNINGDLILISKPKRNQEKTEASYISWHPVADGFVSAILMFGDSMTAAETNPRFESHGVDSLYNIFGCYEPNWVCNPSKVSVR